MLRLDLNDVAKAVNGQLVGADVTVCGVAIDTRTIQAGQLFVAIKGHQFDGHDFASKAVELGAGALLLEHRVDHDIPQIIVQNTRTALAVLANYWRSKLSVKVVGVTGSNGKTTVKEIIAALLSEEAKTLSTQGNLNNDIGVPLTLLRLDESHVFAVIEMGANHPGEINFTSSIAKPDISVITNVGSAHIEGFGNLKGVAETKGEMIENLNSNGVAILNRDDEFFDYWLSMAANHRVVTFGINASADFYAEQIKTQIVEERFVTGFVLRSPDGKKVAYEIGLAGEHNVKNVLIAISVAVECGLTYAQIQQGLAKIKPVTGRMQPLIGRKGNLVIDDTYNANPSSLQAALNSLRREDINWVVLGAFGELGDEAPKLHREMGVSIRNAGVKKLFATGSLTKETVKSFGLGAVYFETQDELIKSLESELTGEERLLVKGSRSQKMENVVSKLVDNFRAS